MEITNLSTTSNLPVNPSSAINSDQRQAGSEARCDVTELADPLATRYAGAASADPARNEVVAEARLNKVLEEARLATGATGAAIALVQGAEIVCCATSGPDAPDLGTRLDPRTGLSGCCVQTRELQQCSDTETDLRVNLEACRLLGIRSIVVLPLMDADQLVGVLEILSSRPEAFGERDLHSVKTLANRILDCRRPQEKANATAPPKDPVLDSVQAELLAREVFLESAQRDTENRRRDYWATFRIASFITVALLVGWILGRIGWNMAVDRAESQLSRAQNEEPAPLQVAPDTVSASSSVEKPTAALSEKTSSPENEAGTLQAPGAGESDPTSVPAQISSDATSSFLLTRVEPEYPKEAKQQHIQGRVVMRVVVGTDGLVRELVVERGDPQLVKSASSAVRQWRFKPHTVNGQPVEFESKITVNFSQHKHHAAQHPAKL